MVFISFVFVLYFIFWVPLVNEMSSNIKNTRSLLTNIPLNIIKTLRGVVIYLRDIYEF